MARFIRFHGAKDKDADYYVAINPEQVVTILPSEITTKVGDRCMLLLASGDAQWVKGTLQEVIEKLERTRDDG
ncbi:hypothetical protein EVC30_069 [Rhizobium phage RHph_Y1_11]|nr:hypothetical protein EVC30_069 [Rhizobium phage RHph_Y1_11]